MKLLWLTHAIPYPPKAGFLARTYYLLREVARQHEVDLISFIQEPWLKTHFASVQVGIEESRRELASFCRKVTFLPIDNVRSPLDKRFTAVRALVGGSTYTTTWLRSASARARISKEIAENCYEAVHFDTIGLAGYRDLIGGTPAVLTHHNVESHMMMRRADNSSNPLARAYFRIEGRRLERIERSIAPAYAIHVTCSELDTERLHAIIGPARIVTIPNGVDCDYFDGGRSIVRPNSLVFVGTMNWYPNVDAMNFFLREVWPRLKDRVPDATFDIAGSNPPDELVKLAQAAPGVTIHGYVPDVRPLIDAAAVFVCPIRDGGGTKLKMLDAFAMRKCVVAHPIACEGIDATDGTHVVLASAPEEFVDRISRMFQAEDERLAIGTAARSLVEERFSFRRFGRNLSDVFESLGGRHGTHA